MLRQRMRTAKTTNVLDILRKSGLPTASNPILHGDNLQVLGGLPDSSVNLIYIDPPFNTGRRQLKRDQAAEPGLFGRSEACNAPRVGR